MWNAELHGDVLRHDPPLTFRIPHSTFRIVVAP